jgi:membrane protein DedA with SNARE-associated domain
MHAIEQQLVAFLQSLFTSIGWGGVIGIMAIESANIPIPSEVTMPLAGWFLVRNSGATLLHAVWQGGLFGALGCTIGSLVSYLLGALGGRPLLEKYGKYIFIRADDLEKADRWFARWGDWAAFLSRLLPIVRTFISFPAGVVRVNPLRFALFTFTGSFIWCAALAAGGWVLGANWEQLRNVMRPFDIPIAIVIVAAVGYYIYRHVRRGRERKASA